MEEHFWSLSEIISMADIRESSLTVEVHFGRKVLGPLSFFICINDLCDDLSCDIKLFADDTSLFTLVFNENI